MPVLIERESSTISRPDRALSTYISPTVLGKIYSIFLWDVDAGEVLTSQNYDVTDQTKDLEHYFTVPPKSVKMSEPFATSITPTQGGGKYTESFGTIIRLVDMSGTTGVRPHKKPRASNPRTFDGNTLSTIGLDPTEITGHDTAMNLRNLFRVYSDLQVDGNSSVVMVYRNVKDDDYWIVEPVKFDLGQDASSPFSYNYTISLKALSRFDKSVLASASGGATGGKDPQEEYESVISIAARMRARQQTLTDSYILTLVNNNLFKGGAITAASEILKPMSDTIRGLEAVSRGVYGSSDILLQNAERLANEYTSNLDSLSDLAATTKVRALRRYWRRGLAAVYGILNEPSYRTTSQVLLSRRTRIQRAYARPGLGVGEPIFPETGGSPTFLSNNPVTTTVAQEVVGASDTIRGLAQRLLGDARRWQELCVINDLKPPYINNVGSDGVLGPGDTILYPSAGASISGVRLQASGNQDYDNSSSTDSTGLLDQTYGRDLRLKSPEVGAGFALSDLAVNQRGDISTIVGTDNIKQAVAIKFSTEKGTLPIHPYFGARFAIGSKATTTSFNTFKLNVLTTLFSDDRIEDVKNLSLVTEGDILYANADILLVNSRDYANTHFALRRF